MFGRAVFLKRKNFHSIVIVVPVHVSKFYRVLKKLTAYLEDFPENADGSVASVPQQLTKRQRGSHV
jgi:hypothetical protein